MNIKTGKNWIIKFNSLSELDPENNDLSKEELEHAILGFTQDLVLIENELESNLIDIGWYPDIDINGEFILSKLTKGKDHEYDWQNPIEEYKTRSLRKLLLRIEELTR